MKNQKFSENFFKLVNIISTASTIRFYVMLRALLPKKTKLNNYDPKISENEVDFDSNEKLYNQIVWINF